jgi:hypothetical protein
LLSFQLPFLYAANNKKIEITNEYVPALPQENLQRISEKLGYEKLEKAQEEYKIFSERIRAGFATDSWMAECPTLYNGNLCKALQSYLNPEKEIRSAKRRGTNARLPLLVKNSDKLQNEDFPSLYKRFPKSNYATLKKLSLAALEKDSCPRNFSLALAVEMEKHSKEVGAWALLDKLYAHGLYCVKDTDEWSEFLHLKVSYTLIARSREKDAVGFLLKALQAKNLREEYRSLYWLYRSAQKTKDVELEKKSREELFSKYPISWFTLLTLHDSGIDPLEKVKSRPRIADKIETGDGSIDLHLNWLKFGLLTETDPYGFIRYGEFVAKKIINTNDISVSQHLAKLFFETKLYRLQILVLAQVLTSKPELFNFEHLNLLFPKPYFETMQQHSGTIDTALLLGLARQESGFDEQAISPAGAKGLMQLLPGVAKEIAKKIKLNYQKK